MVAMTVAHAAVNLKFHQAVASAQEDSPIFVQDNRAAWEPHCHRKHLSWWPRRGGLVLLAMVSCIPVCCVPARKVATVARRDTVVV